MQRRHQKIIKEPAVTIARPERFEQEKAAVRRLAKLVGYVSAELCNVSQEVYVITYTPL